MVAIGRNVPLEPHKRPFVLIRRVGSIGDDIPSKRICFLWGVIGCMALKTLRCCGGASSPEQGSVLRGIHPTNSHKKHTRLLRGLSLMNAMRRRARLCLAWVSRGPYLAAAAMVGLVAAPTAVDYCSPGGDPNKLGIDRKLFLRTIDFF